MDQQSVIGTRTWRLVVLVGVALAAVGLAILQFVRSDRAVAGSGQPAPTTAEAPDARATAQAVAWRDDFDAALIEAGEKERPALLRFTADWCAPCRVMDANVFPDERVAAAIAERVVPVEIDADRAESLDVAHRYGVVGIPTLVLVDAGGNELARKGFMSAEQLLEFLRNAPGAS